MGRKKAILIESDAFGRGMCSVYWEGPITGRAVLCHINIAGAYRDLLRLVETKEYKDVLFERYAEAKYQNEHPNLVHGRFVSFQDTRDEAVVRLTPAGPRSLTEIAASALGKEARRKSVAAAP